MGPLVVVAGARPNFMKVAPLLRAAEGRVATLLVHTGQHYDFAMSGVFFEQLGIRAPDVHLEVGSGGHGVQTGRIMVAFEQYVTGLAEAPAAIVVVGDVNSTMACALVGVKLGIPVVHVEAGLRSFDRTMPEEINRIVTDSIADLLLVSEPAGLVNLAREGIAPERVQYVGNVMIDTLVHQLAAARALRMPERMDLGGEYALVTLHRPSNVDTHGRLAELVGFVERLARETPAARYARREPCRPGRRAPRLPRVHRAPRPRRGDRHGLRGRPGGVHVSRAAVHHAALHDRTPGHRLRGYEHARR